MIDERVMDVCQPDLLYIGGFTRALRIADYAAKRGLQVTPHTSNRSVIFPMGLHYMACIDNPYPFLEVGIEDDLWAVNTYFPNIEIKDGLWITSIGNFNLFDKDEYNGSETSYQTLSGATYYFGFMYKVPPSKYLLSIKGYKRNQLLEFPNPNYGFLFSLAKEGGYGKLVTKGTEFRYDEEGNLAKKIKAKGEVWEYEYYGNGMLSKVGRPDKSEVTFKYDPLGRRIEKRSPEKVVHFLWDGNNPLHEWEEDNDWEGNNVVTWVFNDGFVPSAKLTKDGNFSIITDYLGTPVEAYDPDGERVWSAELDIYGRVKEFTGNAGEVDFIPFRYQGQYSDLETGLYYNRFRYYDPEIGQYTQQDPIGLAGGNPTLYGYVNNPHA
jgi:RHS repeat-associated protein